jgi:Tol biopolymer transport system component
MANRDDEVQRFFDRMASEVHGIDPRTPPRLRRRARVAMGGWALLTGTAAVALPLAVLFTLRLGDHPGPGANKTNAAHGGLDPELVYTRGSQIWLMTPDGSDQHPVTSTGVSGFDPSWSPDGTQIVYVSGTRIMVMDADGGDPRPFPVPGGQPVSARWSPDGSSIAYDDAIPSGQGEGIFLLALSDGSTRLITDNSSGSLISWSPDGAEIAFTRDEGRDGSNVWAVNVGTGRVRQITDDGFGYDPAWSPDGTRIAYFHDSEIWMANADGTGEAQRVTHSDGHESFAPNWSPDGAWITFYSDQPSGHDDLFRIHPDGSGLTRLTDTPNIEKGGSWRPIG